VLLEESRLLVLELSRDVDICDQLPDQLLDVEDVSEEPWVLDDGHTMLEDVVEEVSLLLDDGDALFQDEMLLLLELSAEEELPVEVCDLVQLPVQLPVQLLELDGVAEEASLLGDEVTTDEDGLLQTAELLEIMELLDIKELPALKELSVEVDDLPELPVQDVELDDATVPLLKRLPVLEPGATELEEVASPNELDELTRPGEDNDALDVIIETPGPLECPLDVADAAELTDESKLLSLIMADMREEERLDIVTELDEVSVHCVLELAEVSVLGVLLNAVDQEDSLASEVVTLMVLLVDLDEETKVDV
jgi:hypothetical protein